MTGFNAGHNLTLAIISSGFQLEQDKDAPANVSVNSMHYHPQATHAGANIIGPKFLPGGIRGRDLTGAGHSI